MIRTLRFRLAGLCIGVTALVLVTLTLVCLFISERNIRNQEEASFQINLNTLYQICSWNPPCLTPGCVMRNTTTNF